jgi:hypothetical protein
MICIYCLRDSSHLNNFTHISSPISKVLHHMKCISTDHNNFYNFLCTLRKLLKKYIKKIYTNAFVSTWLKIISFLTLILILNRVSAISFDRVLKYRVLKCKFPKRFTAFNTYISSLKFILIIVIWTFA